MFLTFSFTLILYVPFDTFSVSFKSTGIQILGQKSKTIYRNTEYVGFYNIPYARPAINERRFKSPIEYNPLNNFGTYDYRKPHRQTCAIGNTEDCLYLSIFTPLSVNKTENFPVLVWTHENANNHGPDFFIDEKLLVVTVSFRSSIFGFLNTEDEFAEGNMGAKDILMALKWLRDNINLFNGDPNKITVIGAGIGATPVASMLVSRAAGNLFRRTVIIDDSALSPADYRLHNFEVLNKLYWRLKGRYDKFNRKELYKILLNITSTDLSVGCHNLYDTTEIRDRQRLINAFGCSIEKSSIMPFMNKFPLSLYGKKNVNNNVEVIFGYNTLTNLYKLNGLAKNRNLLKYLNYNFQYLLPFDGKSDEYNSKRYKKIRHQIMNFYFLNGTIGERSLRRYAKYVSDQKIYPLLRQVELHNKSCSNVYLYRFPFKGSLNIGWKSSVPNLEWSGATFGDEICYLFKCKSETDVYKSPETVNERHFIRKIARLFGNFAKYGNPTPNHNDDILGTLQWTKVRDNKKLQAINLGRRFKMIDVPEENRKYFWDQLRKEYFLES